jgi:hypothetical protein
MKVYPEPNIKEALIFSIKALLVILFSLFVGLCFLVFIPILESYPDHVASFESHYINASENIKKKKPFIDLIFLSYFDEAKICRTDICQQEVSKKIHEALKPHLHWKKYEATYFIRLNEKKNIEKLFLHGEWKEEVVDNSQEMKVVSYLNNPNSKEYLKGILIKHFYQNMIFLGDFYSEGEIIVPVKKDDKIIGAIVKLYGQ